MKYNQKKINLEQEDYTTKITSIHFKRIEESLLSQHQRLETQSLLVDCHHRPKRYAALGMMALKVFELWESIIECAEEYELLDLQMLMEGEE